MNSPDLRPILIVEDSDEDFEAMMWAFRRSSLEIPVVRCKDGRQAIQYLENPDQPTEPSEFPAIVLLDLNMPRVDGRDVLKHMKASARLRSLPVVVVTTSAQQTEVQSCYRLGANSYVVKPIGMGPLRELVDGLIEYWFRLVLLPQPESSHGN